MANPYPVLWPISGRKGWRPLPRIQADPIPDFGPTNGAQFIRDEAGPRPVALPGTGTDITVGNLTQTEITNAGTGATIKIREGTHRLTGRINMLSGQQWYLEDGAVIKGSAVVSSWTQGTGADADKWFATGQTQDFSGNSADMGNCTANPVAASELEDFYKDGVPLIAVTSKAAVSGTTDKKFMDRSGNTVWIGFNPSGHTIEKLTFWDGDGLVRMSSNCLLKGGVFEHAAVGVTGAFQTADGSTLEDVEIGYCHFRPFAIGGTDANKILGFTMNHCRLHHGGRYNFNIFHVDNACTIENNEFSHGNFLNCGRRNTTDSPGACGPDDEGGSKLLGVPSLTWRYNWSHDHDGDEWFDTAIGGIIEESVFENTYRHGIFWEGNAVGGITIQRCLFKNTGQTHPTLGDWTTNAGSANINACLQVSCSTIGDVTRNIFETSGITTSSLQGTIKLSWQVNRPDLQNWSFHHNQFKRTVTGSNRGFVTTRGSSNDPLFAVNNNSWNNNEYHVPAGEGLNAHFHTPSGANKTFAQWRAGPVAESDSLDFDPDSTITADL